MSGAIPVVFQLIAQYPQAAVLQPGQTYAGIVREQNSALVAAVGKVRIPLEDGSGLLPGQRVTIQVAASAGGLQLTIAPSGANATTVPPAGAPPAAEPPLTGRILLPLLEALGKLDLAPRVSGILPRQLPATLESLRPLIALLLSDRALGRDLQQLRQILSNVNARSVLPADTASAVAQWLGLAPAADSAEWRALLLRSRTEQAAAARIARTLKPDAAPGALAALKESASGLIERLMTDPALLQWLQEEGELEPFKALGHRIQERAAGVDLQNLRALDQAYQFLELPVPESQGFLRAQIHVFREESERGKQAAGGVYRTVLDLETTRLGALWIALQRSGIQCACHFRAGQPEIVALLEAEAPALQAALAGAGFAGAVITASLWDGDREEALFILLSPYQTLDVEA